MESFSVQTKKRQSFVDITVQVARVVANSGVAEGVCTVFIPHTTAGVTINENADPDVCRDMVSFFGEMVPEDWGFAHMEGNSDAHIKASLMGSSVQIPITSGHLALGTWQGIYFAEFDGPRSRKCHVSITS